MGNRPSSHGPFPDPLSPWRLLRLEEVLAIVGVSKSALYQWIEEGLFPAPVRVGKRGSRWRASEVAAWVEALPPATLANLL